MVVAGKQDNPLEVNEAVVDGGDGLQVRWLVGWSSTRALDPNSIIRDSMHRTFSPPERTLTGLYTSSPENSIRPRKDRLKDSVFSSALSAVYWPSQSTRFRSQSLKKAELSRGK